MDDHAAARQGGAGPWDLLATELGQLRSRAGDPSYATIAALVTDRRTAAGASPHAARIARSTIYDCFRAGRTRMNLGLVREIALVLGAGDGQVDGWIEQCRTPDELAVPPGASTPAEDHAATGAGAARTLLVLAACVVANLAGRTFSELFELPIYLDMVGTAVAAIALGPWRGAGVGVATNLLGIASSGPASIPFAAVNVAGALLWGYGIRSWGMGRTLPRFFGLSVLVAIACSAAAVPILLLLYGGSTGHGQDTISATIYTFAHAHAVAVAGSNLLVSLADKVISGFVALVVVSTLPRSLRPAPELVPFTTEGRLEAVSGVRRTA